MKKTIYFDLMGTLGGDGMGDYTMFEWFDIAKDAIRMINDNQDQCVIVTNQSRIGKGLVSYEGYLSFEKALINDLAKEGLHVDGIYCCPHTREDKCTCKKPKNGMIIMAEKDLCTHRDSSYIVGDMGMSDIVLANKMGFIGILVLTGNGRGSLGEYRSTWSQYEADYVAEHCLDAVKWIYEKERDGHCVKG